MSKINYYGEQTKKALSNFPFSYPLVQKELIYSLSEIKEAAAMTNNLTGALPKSVADAIVQACKEIREGRFDDQFPISAFQGGAGTSINMNINEVIASRATELLTDVHDNHIVHSNDDVNKSQSTNDVNPSALKITSIKLLHTLVEVLQSCVLTFNAKEAEFTGIDKLGRTHLQDAVPTTLGEEFSAYKEIIIRHKQRIQSLLPFLYELNLGGTAIGNCINAPVEYRRIVYEELRKVTNLPLKPAENFMAQTSSQTDFVMVSQALVLLTLDLSKIASDLRLLSSGPNGGLGEIFLLELQPGSSIMPGKVNPILPEAVNQLYFMISGNNLTIEQAAHGAQLELGVMFPILADRLLSSIKLTTEVIDQFSKNCIAFVKVNEKNCKMHLEKSTAYATLLTPILGYDVVSNLVKETIKTGKTLRELVMEQQLLPEPKFNQLMHTHRSRIIPKEEE